MIKSWKSGLFAVALIANLGLLGAQLLVASDSPFLRTTAHVDQAPVRVIGGDEARVQLLLHRGLGLSAASMNRIVGTPGWKIPPHKHEHSDELLFVLEGGGGLTLGDRTVRVREQMAVWIPKNQEHSWETGPHGVTALQVYAPGGPEQRFLKAPLLKP